MPWTTGDLLILRDNAALGAARLAVLLDRSEGSVRQAAYRYRVSLRPFGCRRGRVLGQPPGISLRSDLREALVDSAERAELVARRLKADREAELCPECARRPQRVPSSGLCVPCHLNRLEALIRETAAEDEAQLGYNVAKQRAHRNREAQP